MTMLVTTPLVRTAMACACTVYVPPVIVTIGAEV